MTAEERQHIEQRTYGITIAQVAQLVANRQGDAAAFAVNTAKIAANKLATAAATQSFNAQQLEALDAVRIYLNRIQLALTELDGFDQATLTTLEAEQ